MPTILGREYPPKVQVFPPHMASEDLPIYTRWAIDGLKGALRQFFDVGLGLGADPIPGISQPIRNMWEKVTQKRADAVIEYENHVKLIEFRHMATANAIGRVLTYHALWKDDRVIPKAVELYLVTNHGDRDVERMCKLFDITYMVV